jgi:hypothetical protein
MRIARHYKGILKPRIVLEAVLDGTYYATGVRRKGINTTKVVVADHVNNLVSNQLL